MGKSPLFTVHDADTMSNALISSSPKLNGTICGKTGEMIKIQMMVNRR